MARNLPQLTLKATGKLNKHSLSRLKECLELQRNLYNSSLDWLAHRPSPDFRTLRDSLRKDLTPCAARTRTTGASSSTSPTAPSSAPLSPTSDTLHQPKARNQQENPAGNPPNGSVPSPSPHPTTGSYSQPRTSVSPS